MVTENSFLAADSMFVLRFFAVVCGAGLLLVLALIIAYIVRTAKHKLDSSGKKPLNQTVLKM